MNRENVSARRAFSVSIDENHVADTATVRLRIKFTAVLMLGRRHYPSVKTIITTH